MFIGYKKHHTIHYKIIDTETCIDNLCLFFSFTMKNGAQICADPSLQWVKNLMQAKEKLPSN